MNQKLKGQFILAGVADEERGSTLGLEYLLNECGIKADFAIIPDVAHNMQLIDVTEKGTLFGNYLPWQTGSRFKAGNGDKCNMEYDPLLERIKQLKFKHTSHPLHTPPTLNLGSIHSGNVTQYRARRLQGTTGHSLFAR